MEHVINMLLKANESTTKSNRKLKKYLEINDNKSKTKQNLWDTAKAVLRIKFTVARAFLKTYEKFQTT